MRAPFIALFLPLLLGFQAANSFQTPASPISSRLRHRRVSSSSSNSLSAPTTNLLVNPRGGQANVPTTTTTTQLDASSSTEEWTKKRLHNTAAFRSVALLTALLVAGFSSKSPLLKHVPTQALGSLHMLSFATWFGMVAYTTFVAGITMFHNLPRQVFGKLQAKLFPKYFSISSVALVLQLITLKSLKAMKPAAAHNSAKCLAVALLMTAVNQYYLEPVSTKNMMERYDLENAGKEGGDRYKELKKSFGKFHGMSSLTNLIALGCGVAHAVYMASTLVIV